ncbi:MAG TPA: DUF6268 family outer membrane beta-barrel protein [Candidatus Omnitrophota bacterium]|nr:DUF6268 family outer membrane beta-barrel protein [Candidatus Omnitrophota bacterium]HPT07281.1 DUF6268 family outer membrane beta-barrel protein [Candidatus Omnitrophota bacterium]
MNRSYRMGAVLICTVFFSYAQAAEKQVAQKEVSPDSVEQLSEGLDRGVEEQPEGVHQKAAVFVRYLPSRSLKAQNGKVSILQSESEYDYEFKAFGKMPVVLSYSNEYINIEESGLTANSLPAHLTSQSVGVEATLPFFNVDKTYLRLRVMPSMNTDDWDMHSSAFRIPVHIYAIHQPNDQLTLIGGVAVYADYEDRFFPIIGFIYKPNNTWTFNLVAPRPNVQYALNGKITLFGEMGFADQEFEVKKDDVQGQVLRYRENRCGAGLKYAVNKHLQASLSSGYVFQRYLKYGDSRGKFNINNDVYTELRVEVEI